MARLIAYARQSDPYEKDQTSLQGQILRCKSFAVTYNHDIVATYTENYSGASSIGSINDLLNPDTPKVKGRHCFKKVLQLITDGYADGIIVFKLDRFSRNFVDNAILFAHFKQHNYHLISVLEMFDIHTAAGKMMANILATFAEHDREMILERLSRGKVEKARHGSVVHGRNAYGTLHVKQFAGNIQINTIQPNHAEQAIIADIMNLYRERWQHYIDSGCRNIDTYAAIHGGIWKYIANILNERGIPAKRGGLWHPTSVRSIVMGHCQRREMIENQAS